MHDFDYSVPGTLAEAVSQLASLNGAAKPLAGGTDLIDQMRIGRLRPNVVIDVKRIPELNVLTADNAGLRLGAAVPCYQVYGHAAIQQTYSALADSCRIIGGVQVQSRASVGGNLCNAGPAADSIPSLIALGAVCVIARQGGARELPVESFCTGPGKNALEAGELLVELRMPRPAANSGSHYRRVTPRNEMDIAVVGVGASITLDDTRQRIVSARIALGAVGPTPLFAQAAGDALAGQAADDAQALARAAALARQIASPITDMRGTREYREHVTGVLVERVVQAAIARARGEKLAYCIGH